MNKEKLTKLIPSIVKKTGLVLSTVALAAMLMTTAVGCPTGDIEIPGNEWIDKDNDGYHDITDLDKDGFDRNGFDKDGIHKETGTQYNPAGFDKKGFDEEGYNKNGFDKDGFDRDGHDVYGYDKKGFDSEGIHRVTERAWDETGKDKAGNRVFADKDGDGFDDYSNLTQDGQQYKDGYDYQGNDVNGFNKAGIHKETGKTWNPTGYGKTGERLFVDENNDGYDDISGLDINGFQKLEPVARINFGMTPTMMDTQSVTYLAMSNGNTRLRTQAVAIATQFEQYAPNGAIKNAVLATSRQIANYNVNYSSRGDNIVRNGLLGNLGFADATSLGPASITNYIVAMTNALPNEKQEKFALLMDAFRTNAYLGHRNNQNVASNAELQGLYTQLSSMGVDTNNNINQYFDTVVVPGLSKDLELNPGLIRSVLNQITNFEQLYALLRLARERGFKPTLMDTINDALPSEQIPERTLAYTRTFITDAQNRQQSQNQNMGQ